MALVLIPQHGRPVEITLGKRHHVGRGLLRKDHVVGDDPFVGQRKLLVLRVKFMDRVHDRREEVRLEIVLLALNDGDEPLEA